MSGLWTEGEGLRPYRDRREAGRALAALLRDRVDGDVLVLALPRGGVPVADEVARALRAPLDVVVARKIGAPGHEEYGVGAIAEGVEILDEEALRDLRITRGDLEDTILAERTELRRRERLYRDDRPEPGVQGRTVVLVDDGIATGVTARAAIASLRARGARRIVLAVPVAAPTSAAAIAHEVDDIVVGMAPPMFHAVGEWYRDFSQTSDAEVLAILRGRSAGPASASIRIPAPDGGVLQGDLAVPAGATALVLFAHGSGSGRLSPRNREVAAGMQAAGLGTLLFDLLTDREEREDVQTREHRFDIPLLAHRVQLALAWVKSDVRTRALPVALYGSSTGAAAAIVAASRERGRVAAVVSRGGRPDLAGDALPQVGAPTLLIVGSADHGVIELNEAALQRLPPNADMVLVEGATHLFEEPGTLAEAGRLATGWILRHAR